MSKYSLIPAVAVQINYLDIFNTIKNFSKKENIIDEFKGALNRNLGYKYSLLFPSASLALKELLYELSKKSKKREVIIPAYTCPSVYYAVIESGLIPVLVDIDIETLAIDGFKLESLITNNTLAVVVVHMFGKIADLKKIKNFIKSKDLILIEDMAQALDKYNDKNNENVCLGDYCLLSFAKAKCISTIEGGAILSNDEPTLNNLEKITNSYPSLNLFGSLSLWMKLFLYSIAINPFIYYWIEKLSTKMKEDDPYKIRDKIKVLNKKYRYTKLQAAIGIEMIKQLEKLNAIRFSNGKLFNSIDNNDYLKLKDEKNLYFRFVLLLKEKDKRLQILKAFYAQGIKASTADYPVFNKLEPKAINYQDRFEVAEYVANNIVTIPTHHILGEKEKKSILNILTSI